MLFTINENQLVAPLDHAKYVICSSLLLLLPTYLAFQKKQYLITIALLIAALLSINHWRLPIYSWRRIADHISGKILFLIFLVKFLFTATNPFFILSSITCLVLSLYCYYMSDKYCNCDTPADEVDPCWWKYHVLFHVFGVSSQILVLSSI